MKGNDKVFYIGFIISIALMCIGVIFTIEDGMKMALVLLATTVLLLGIGAAVYFAIAGISKFVNRVRSMPFHGETSVKKYYKKIKKWDPTVKNATLTLNGKFLPELRRKFEKGIDDMLRHFKIGVVIGGECIYKERMEVDHCEIHLSLRYDASGFIQDIAAHMDKIFRIPRGSLLQGPHGFCPLGHKAGLALYLDITNIPVEGFQEKYNSMLSSIAEAFKEKDWLAEIWEAKRNVSFELDDIHPHMVGIYYYSDDYDDMKSAIEPIVKETIFAEAYKIVRCA